MVREVPERVVVRDEIDLERINKIAERRAMLTGTPATAPNVSTKARRGRKRKFSPEALQRMREAQRRRWAKVRGESAPKAAPDKPKRKLSAAGPKGHF
jgi:hypothetical protein